MILILRGHIRESFNDNLLAFFVKTLCDKYEDLKIYIHTWNKFASPVSWREIEENDNIVTEELIKNYFKDVDNNIVSITIEDDKRIWLIGRLEGNVYSSFSPISGWKRMWYGKYKTIETVQLNESENDVVINTRFDLFIYSCSANFSKLLLFIEDCLNKNEIRKRNVFYLQSQLHGQCGCESFYMGNVNTMHMIASIFHYNLDNLHLMYNGMHNPELSVIDVNNRLFLNH